MFVPEMGILDLRYPLPPPPVYWNHRVRGKCHVRSSGTVSCGQNLELRDLARRTRIRHERRTSLASAMIAQSQVGRQGRMSHEEGLSCGKRFSDLVFSVYCGLHVMSTRTGISFFTGMVRSEGGSILKSESVVGIVPVMCFSLPWVVTSNETCW